MPNITGAAQAICPFYRGESQWTIDCEGFGKSVATKVCFTARKRKEQWQETRCNRYEYAQACQLAGMLLEGYERKERERAEKTPGRQ